MDISPFYNLARMSRDGGSLRDIYIKENLAMFLQIIGHNAKNRVASLDFIQLGKTTGHTLMLQCAIIRL